MEGARAEAMRGARGGWRRASGMADGSQAGPVRLEVAFANETAFREGGLEVERGALGMGDEAGVPGEDGEGLQDPDHRFWRFEAAHIKFEGGVGRVGGRQSGGLSHEENLEAAVGLGVDGMTESALSEDAVEGGGFERGDEAQRLPGLELFDCGHDAGKRFASSGEVVSDIDSDIVGAHDGGSMPGGGRIALTQIKGARA